MNLNHMAGKFQEKIRDNVLLWALIFGLNIGSLFIEVLMPVAERPFSLSDISISYPYAEVDTYTPIWLGLATIVFPISMMVGFIVMDGKDNKFHRFYKGISGLLFAMGFSLFITTFLKIRMAKLRPDFLARCVPVLKSGESTTGLFTQEVCSSPYGEMVMRDGYKSNPSGHSALAFVTMVFLSMWLYNTYLRKSHNGLLKIMCSAPLLVALDVSTSRIYDFRHDYYDVYFGSVIGVLGAVVSYFYVFLDKPEDEGNPPLLPL